MYLQEDLKENSELFQQWSPGIKIYPDVQKLLKMQVLWPRIPGEDKSQRSLLFSPASYPLIEIKKHRLDTMKAKQVSFFWNVIWHMEKEDCSFLNTNRIAGVCYVYCKGKNVSVDLNFPNSKPAWFV